MFITTRVALWSAGLFGAKYRTYHFNAGSDLPLLIASARRWSKLCETLSGRSRFMRPERKMSQRIHILGIGNMGSFVAHSLAGLPDRIPVTLVLHRRALLDAWKAKGETIDLVLNGKSELRGGFDIECATWAPVEANLAFQSSKGSPEHINNLIVSVKAPMTLSALTPLRDRLTERSTILFLHNGMGVVDGINAGLFPDPTTRPQYLLGIVSHGINSTRPFTIIHAGYGKMSLGSISTEREEPSSKYLQETLLQVAGLNVVVCSQAEILRLQWEKLVVNAVINPWTAIMDCSNGALLEHSTRHSIRLLISEISTIIEALPEMTPETKRNFRPERLERLVLSIATATSSNISSMLQDMRAGKRTEIEYINGYIIRRAEELGVACDENHRLMRKVLQMQQERILNKK